MATELVTLKPTVGPELSLSDPYFLGQELEWGDHVVEPALVEGPDVIGAIAGTRRRVVSEATIPVRIRVETTGAYLAAAEALSDAAASLALNGGLITRQIDFGGTLSEQLECEVLACTIDPEDGWFQAHRLTSVVTLNITRNPGWLAEEELAASDSSFTDSVKRLSFAALRGNLPAPGRLVLTDNTSEVRRFAEIGGAFTQDPQEVEYLADDFTLVAGTLETDADAIDTEALEVTPVPSVWTTVASLEDLPHRGSFRVRVRVKGGEDDAQYVTRVLWRPGPQGSWHDLGERVQTPDADNFYDVDAGSIYHYGLADTIELRVDVRATAFSSDTYSFNGLTITPSELYAVAKGVEIEQPATGTAAFDDFVAWDSLEVLDSHVAPQGGTWDEAGSGSGVEFVRGTFPHVQREGADDGTSNLGTGYYAFLTDGTGATTYDDVLCTVSGSLAHPANADATTQTMLLAIARFVDANNWLGAGIRIRMQTDGHRTTYFEVYKRVGGTITRLAQKEGLDSLTHGTGMSISATAAGAWSAQVGGFTFSGSDSSLAPSAALDDGKVGMYSLIQHDGDAAYTRVDQIAAYGATSPVTFTEIIRDSGIGVFTSENSYVADTDGSAPQLFTTQGSRIWLPSGVAGEVTIKTRSGDSDTEPDQGFNLATGASLFYRPTYATLSDVASGPSAYGDDYGDDF